MRVDIKGPYKKKKIIPWGEILLEIIFTGLLLILFGWVFLAVCGGRPAIPSYPTWFSEKEAKRMMRYHGVRGLRITEQVVQIKKDGKWITVRRRMLNE